MAVLSCPSRHWVLRSGQCWLRLFIVLLAPVVVGQTPNVEYRIKAAYLLNFAKFVSWPSHAFAAPDSPIVIGILGKDPFGAEIDQTVAGKKIEERPLQIRRLNENDQLDGCHILFIADSERKHRPYIVENARRLPILTVGETEDFTDAGGMIRFLKYDNTIRFEIDLEPVQRANLKISSKVLQVAIVKGKTQK